MNTARLQAIVDEHWATVEDILTSYSGSLGSGVKQALRGQLAAPVATLRNKLGGSPRIASYDAFNELTNVIEASGNDTPGTLKRDLQNWAGALQAALELPMKLAGV